MVILPSAYLPPISYFCAMMHNPTTIDIGEHYIKRTLRNRTRIMTAQGVMELTIPVKRANSPRSPMQGMEIDNSKRWQHQHWVSILSAYRSSPYFEYYAPYIEPLYKTQWQYLTEFNAALICVITKLLRLENKLTTEVSQTYITATKQDIDLRAKGAIEEYHSVEEYIQVFSDRLPHEPNLSILDLLFCEGTNAPALLMASHK